MKKKIDLVDKEHNSEKWKSGSFDDESGNKLKRQRWKMFWVVFPKRANVTPVFKVDAKDVVKNYRSISLLSIPSKCQERIVYNAVYPHVAPYLTDWQHGFLEWPPWMRANRRTLFSWTLQRHLTEWHIISCCKKLGNFDISGALLNWCKDYFTDREQRVVIEGMNSTWWAIPLGIPRGSLLGPLFFVIFISDLTEVVMPGNCVSLYADDCKTSRIINCPADHSVFQSDLDNL